MSPVETMEVDSPVTEVEVEVAKKEVKDVDTTTTEGLVYFMFICRTLGIFIFKDCIVPLFGKIFLVLYLVFI